MTTKDRLRDTLADLFANKEEKRILIPAKLGTIIGGVRVVDVPRRPGFVYVRLRGNYSEQVEAYNDSVNTVFDLPILVEKDRFAQSIYRVVGRDVGLYSAGGWPGGAGLAPHGDQHSFGYSTGSGSDIVWVFKRQFMPLLVHPHPNDDLPLWIQAEEDWYSWGRDYLHFTGATMSIQGAIPPSGESRFVHFYVDADTQLKAITGTTFATFPYPDNQTLFTYIPTITVNEGISLCAMMLHYSTTVLEWKHFYDTRAMLNGGNVQQGNSFVLIDVSAGYWIEYPPTAPGFQAAIDDSDTNDVILYPITTITGTFSLKRDTTLIGTSEFSSKLIGALVTSNNTIDRINIATYTTGIASPLQDTPYPSIYIHTGTLQLTNSIIVNTSQLLNALPVGIQMNGTGSVFIRNSYIRSHSLDASNRAYMFYGASSFAYQIEAHYNTFSEFGSVLSPISNLWHIINTGTVNHYANSWPYDYDVEQPFTLFREGDRQPITLPSSVLVDTALPDIDQLVEVDASSSSITVTLPAIDEAIRKISIVKIDSSAFQVIIDGNGSETINGDTTLILEFQYDAATLMSSSSGWRIV